MGYSGARGTLIYENNLKAKISCQTPFKAEWKQWNYLRCLLGSEVLVHEVRDWWGLHRTRHSLHPLTKHHHWEGINNDCKVVFLTVWPREERGAVSHQWCDLFYRLLHSSTRHIEEVEGEERDTLVVHRNEAAVAWPGAIACHRPRRQSGVIKAPPSHSTFPWTKISDFQEKRLKSMTASF